jgi:hypothetical protein
LIRTTGPKCRRQVVWACNGRPNSRQSSGLPVSAASPANRQMQQAIYAHQIDIITTN